MSHQKRQVSVDTPFNNPKSVRYKNARKNEYEYEGNDKREWRIQKRRRNTSDFEEASSTSVEGHPKSHRRSRKNSSSLYSANSQLLALRLEEIDLLRDKIVELEDTLSMYENRKINCKSKHSSIKDCFSFLNGFSTCKKANQSCVDVFNSKMSFDPQSHEQSLNDLDWRPSDKSIKRKIREEKKRRKERENCAKQHRITNNNTIVLPESYALAQNSGEAINNVTEKLEEHSNEIKEIKLRLNQCIELLAGAPTMESTSYTCKPQLFLDEYIKVNATRTFGPIYGNTINNGLVYVSKPLSIPKLTNNSATTKSVETSDTITIEDSFKKPENQFAVEPFSVKDLPPPEATSDLSSLHLLKQNESNKSAGALKKCTNAKCPGNRCTCGSDDPGHKKCGARPTSCFVRFMRCILCRPAA